MSRLPHWTDAEYQQFVAHRREMRIWCSIVLLIFFVLLVLA